MGQDTRPEDEKCPLVGDVIHCRCGNPSSHYGTMGERGAREVRDQLYPTPWPGSNPYKGNPPDSRGRQ